MVVEEVPQYFTRTYLEGDEVSIVDLFEKAYKNYGGYTLKTPEYWRWCCLKRPDVEKESVFLVSSRNSKKLVGYAVVGKSGTIWELVYDHESDGKEIVDLLLEQATAYLEKKGASSVNFTAPQNEPVMKLVCKQLGFTAGLPPKMFLSVLSLENLFSTLTNNAPKELAEFNESLLIRVTDAPQWISNSVLLNLASEGVTVENEGQTPTIQLQVGYSTLSSLLFGNISPTNALLHFKLKVTPLRKIFNAIKILAYLQIKSQWSFQMSEYG
jgi:ribosomal protein S18 acetylase RimI-like enzyme